MSTTDLENKEKLKSFLTELIDKAPMAMAAPDFQPILKPDADKIQDGFQDLMENTYKVGKNKYTRGVWADWKDLHDPIFALHKYNSDSFPDLELFGFYMGLGKVDMELGRKLLASLKTEDKKLYTIYFDKHKNDEIIVQNEYLGRMTIFVHLSYHGKLIKNHKYSRPLASGGDVTISTIYDVGRLCPPKCPPEYILIK